MRYEELLEKLMQHYTVGEFEDEAKEAKQEFYKIAGIFDEESFNLEMKLMQFIDWYVFSRPLRSTGESLISKALSDSKFEVLDEEKPFYINLNSNRHSLFEFIKVKGEDVYIKDLFSDYKMTLKKSSVVVGFSKDEIFETRLIPHEDSFLFSDAFCIHPAEATKYILKEIKQVKKLEESAQAGEREKLITKLFRMRHKVDQYKHIKLNEIYTNEPRLKF